MWWSPATAAAIPTFSGVSDASGVRINLTATGLPLTNTPVDGGGPTATSTADSVGGGQGYAAMPDPGQFLTSISGLAKGLLASGAVGLPPIPTSALPPIPNYPFYVTASSLNASDSIGDGTPYQIKTSCTDSSCSATAVTGLGLTGAKAALLTSSSSVGPTSDGGALATATTSITGIDLGLVKIGKIASSATETMSPSGVITPTTSLSITALSIGGIDVGINTSGLTIGSTNVPMPLSLSDALAKVLKLAGITLTIQAPEKTGNTILAPVVKLVFPFKTPYVQNVGQFDGAATLTLGYTTASLSGTPAAPIPTDTGGIGSGGLGGGGLTGGLLPGGTTNGVRGGLIDPGTSDLPTNGSSAGDVPTDTTTSPTAGGSQPPPTTVAALVKYSQFDIGPIYLLFPLGALAFLFVAAFMSRSGLRSWISSRS